ncbi:MAG: hypothetical protein ACYDEF_01120 [Methanosarcina sp.]
MRNIEGRDIYLKARKEMKKLQKKASSGNRKAKIMLEKRKSNLGAFLHQSIWRYG